LSAPQEWIIELWQEARRKKILLVIDEIQKIENWAEVVKKLSDEDKRNKKALMCVLLGSSSLQIQKGLTESLTGRFQLIQAFHWNLHETGSLCRMGLSDYLKFGGYPGAYGLANDLPGWTNYLRHSIVETVLEKDILTYHTVKSPSLFKQAFELVTSYPAQEISLTKLLGQLQNKGNTDLVKHYLRLFEGAYLIKILEKYSTNQIKRKSSSPKILPLCPALYYLQIQQEYSAQEKGRVFELIVGCQLVRLNGELFYWREDNFEVDYVFKSGKKVTAFEVKSGRKKFANGLVEFAKRFPNSKQVIITEENYEEFHCCPARGIA